MQCGLRGTPDRYYFFPMSSRIDAAFTRLRASGSKAFVAYICAGDPDLERSLEIVKTLESCGVDIIELGLPFSDPLADGIVNQMAAGRARAAGADGVLLLDLPPDEATLNEELCETGSTLQHIRLIAPTTPPERMQRIAASGDGFIYYISREGVTGAQTTLADNIASQVAVIKGGGSATPVCVGFGISTPEQSKAVAAAADGVVVGSAIVKVIAEHGNGPELAEALRAFVEPLVRAAKE